MQNEMSDTLYLRQIELGQMANYVYLIGSTRTKEAAVSDPAWEIEQIIELTEADGMRLTHILITHTHPDHVGGKLFHLQIQGVAELLDRIDAQVVVHKAEASHLTPLAGSNIKRVGAFQYPRGLHTERIPTLFCVFQEAHLSWISILPAEPPMARLSTLPPWPHQCKPLHNRKG